MRWLVLLVSLAPAVAAADPLHAFWDVPGEGLVGEPYSAGIRAQDGTPPYDLTLQGTLPHGVRWWVEGAALVVRGTPEEAGTFTMDVRVADMAGGSEARTFRMVILPAPGPGILTKELPDAQVGSPYLAQLEAEDPATFSLVDGALPPGLSLAADGTLSGTPAGPAGSSVFSVEARAGAGFERQPMSLRVLPREAEEQDGGGCHAAGGAPGFLALLLLARGRRQRSVSCRSTKRSMIA